MIKWRCNICRRIKAERFILVDALNKVYIVSRETYSVRGYKRIMGYNKVFARSIDFYGHKPERKICQRRVLLFIRARDIII